MRSRCFAASERRSSRSVEITCFLPQSALPLSRHGPARHVAAPCRGSSDEIDIVMLAEGIPCTSGEAQLEVETGARIDGPTASRVQAETSAPSLDREATARACSKLSRRVSWRFERNRRNQLCPHEARRRPDPRPECARRESNSRPGLEGRGAVASGAGLRRLCDRKPVACSRRNDLHNLPRHVEASVAGESNWGGLKDVQRHKVSIAF